eukprot:2438939-Prorocentrum_lima.AAC.1
MVKVIQELRALQQDFTNMEDNMASELTVLEGTIPNAKEVEPKLMDIDGSLMGINKNVEGLDRGLSYVVAQ